MPLTADEDTVVSVAARHVRRGDTLVAAGVMRHISIAEPRSLQPGYTFIHLSDYVPDLLPAGLVVIPYSENRSIEVPNDILVPVILGQHHNDPDYDDPWLRVEEYA